MKTIPFFLSALLLPFVATAAPRDTDRSRQMVEDIDGVIVNNEYRRISGDGSITSRPCPYTCSMRGIQRKNCRQWKSSLFPDRCYVQDLAQSTPQEFTKYFSKQDAPKSEG